MGIRGVIGAIYISRNCFSPGGKLSSSMRAKPHPACRGKRRINSCVFTPRTYPARTDSKNITGPERRFKQRHAFRASVRRISSWRSGDRPCGRSRRKCKRAYDIFARPETSSFGPSAGTVGGRCRHVCEAHRAFAVRPTVSSFRLF